MKRKFFTVIGCRINQPKAIIGKGNRAIANLTENAATFPDIPNDAAALQPEVEKLEVLEGLTDGGSEQDTANRNDQAALVYNMLLENIDYIDKIAKGDKAKILLSGYDASKEPQVKSTPGIPSIKEIVDGPEPHSAKVKLSQFEVGALHIVEYRAVGEPTWKLGVQTTNSRELIITGLEKAKEIEVQVADQNSAGKGKPTPVMTFLPR